MRKSLFKSKEVLFKNSTLEVGTITSINNAIEIDVTLIITNLSTTRLSLIQIKWEDSREICVIEGREKSERKLKAGEQTKQDIRVQINNIDGRCIVMVITYQEENCPHETLALVLPISKFKLVKTLPFTAHSNKK